MPFRPGVGKTGKPASGRPESTERGRERKSVKRKTLRVFVLSLLLAGMSVLFPPLSTFCRAENEAAADPETASVSADGQLPPEFQDLDGKRFGVQTGSTFDRDVLAWFPHAQIVYYNSLPDLAVALQTGKIDAFPSDEIALEMMRGQGSEMTVLEPYMDHYSIGFVFAKTKEGGSLRDEMDAWMTEAKESGVLDKMLDKWLHADEADKFMPDYEDLPAENGTLVFATEAGFPPFDYMRSGEVVGFEVEMAIAFCASRGYGIEIIPMNFDGILPALQSGRIDFSASGFAITPERMESINFSQPYYSGGTKIVVSSSGDVGKLSFFDRILDSIEKTFVREDRWKLFVQGSINTLLITVLSILCGTLLGFAVFLLCRSRGVVINTVTSWFMWLLQGMPMVVLLMILYYIIFGNTSLSGMVISIVGFSLTFGVAVFGMLKTAVAAVDNGQYEAACALGYTPRRTFFRIILPQALPFMTEPYRGEIIGLIKATSIVGYIAVLDLAKMGDLVRSRTYEAFFPLIAVMLIYFILEGILGTLVRVITDRMDPRKRKNGLLLKGVKEHD